MKMKNEKTPIKMKTEKSKGVHVVAPVHTSIYTATKRLGQCGGGMPRSLVGRGQGSTSAKAHKVLSRGKRRSSAQYDQTSQWG